VSFPLQADQKLRKIWTINLKFQFKALFKYNLKKNACFFSFKSKSYKTYGTLRLKTYALIARLEENG